MARNIALAASAGARVHVRQISTAGAVEMLARLKDHADITVEVSPQNLSFTEEDYGRLGIWAKASPALRKRTDVAALREAVASGLIDMVVTDHAPHALEEKREARDFASVPGGMPGVQTLLPVMLSFVDRGLLGLPDLVRLCSEAPARRFGLVRKGRIEVGNDADLVLLDPAGFLTVRNADQKSRAGYTLFHGLAINWSIDGVFLRGRAVAGPVAPAGASGRVLGPG